MKRWKPWKARQIGANVWRIETVPDGDYVPLSVALVVTTVLEVGVSYSDAADNALLIAAAPEMEEILQDLIKGRQYDHCVDRARAILAKIDNGNSDDQK